MKTCIAVLVVFAANLTNVADSGPVAKEGLRRQYCDLFIENVNRLMKQ